MPINGLPYTSTEEIEAIRAHYAKADGSLDSEAIARDIQNGNSPYSTEDLISVYVQENNALPEFMTALAASIPNPDDPAIDHLFTEEVQDTLEALGDMYADANSDITSFLNAFRNNPMGRAEDFMNRQIDHSSDQEFVSTLDLYDVSDREEAMALFNSIGSPGMAYLLFCMFGSQPVTQEGRDEILAQMDDVEQELADALSDLEVDPDSPDAQQQLNIANERINTLKNIRNTLQQMMTVLSDLDNQGIEFAQSLLNKENQVLDFIARS